MKQKHSVCLLLLYTKTVYSKAYWIYLELRDFSTEGSKVPLFRQILILSPQCLFSTHSGGLSPVTWSSLTDEVILQLWWFFLFCWPLKELQAQFPFLPYFRLYNFTKYLFFLICLIWCLRLYEAIQDNGVGNVIISEIICLIANGRALNYMSDYRR